MLLLFILSSLGQKTRHTHSIANGQKGNSVVQSGTLFLCSLLAATSQFSGWDNANDMCNGTCMDTQSTFEWPYSIPFTVDITSSLN